MKKLSLILAGAACIAVAVTAQDADIDELAAQRIYELKGRPPARPAAVMFFALEPALRALGDLSHVERRALQALLPGPVTLLIENRSDGFAAACRNDPATRTSGC